MRFKMKEYLSELDEIGYNSEYSLFKVFQHAKVSKYLTYHNPWNKHMWKRQIGNGYDFQFTVGQTVIEVENKHCNANYPIRKQWFLDSVLPRFKHEANKFHIRVLLCNRPKNYSSVRAENFAAQIRTLNTHQLIELIQYLSTVDYTVSHNSTINHQLEQQRVTSIEYAKIRSQIVLEMAESKKRETERLRELYAG